MEATLQQTQRPQLAFKLPLEVYQKFVKFCEANPMVSKTKIITKAMDYYLDDALRGVDSHLNPTKAKK